MQLLDYFWIGGAASFFTLPVVRLRTSSMSSILFNRLLAVYVADTVVAARGIKQYSNTFIPSGIRRLYSAR